jgi:hypothetical protein
MPGRPAKGCLNGPFAVGTEYTAGTGSPSNTMRCSLPHRYVFWSVERLNAGANGSPASRSSASARLLSRSTSRRSAGFETPGTA